MLGWICLLFVGRDTVNVHELRQLYEFSRTFFIASAPFPTSSVGPTRIFIRPTRSGTIVTTLF